MVMEGDKCVFYERKVSWRGRGPPRGLKTHLLLTSHGKQREWEEPVQINTSVKGKLITEA